MSGDYLGSWMRMLAEGKPEVEEIKGEIPVTKSVEFDTPSIQRRVFDGTQKLWRFKNGYGASVVQHLGSYGHEEGSWELAVLKFDNKGEWVLTYDTSITTDVIGHLSTSEVEEKLKEIRGLKHVV